MLAAKQLFSIVALSAFLTVASAQARLGCSRNGTVQAGDTCESISSRESVSTFQLLSSNDNITDLCDNLFQGEELCLGLDGQDCNTVVTVQSLYSCSSIATIIQIPLSTLLANNPNVNPDCSNLFIGEALCVSGAILVPQQAGQSPE